jgi:hypothetical protein
MKYLALVTFALLAACAAPREQTDPELAAHLEAESDFARHQYHVQQAIEKQYDPEYIDDCFYYEELICEDLGE